MAVAFIYRRGSGVLLIFRVFSALFQTLDRPIKHAARVHLGITRSIIYMPTFCSRKKKENKLYIKSITHFSLPARTIRQKLGK